MKEQATLLKETNEYINEFTGNVSSLEEAKADGKSCKQQIENMKKAFAENSFKDATTGKITNTSNK